MIEKFTFFVGLPGAGKSTYIEQCIKEPLIISADEIKKTLPLYDEEHPEIVHEESVRKAKEAIHELVTSSVTYPHVLLDGGGINRHYNEDLIHFIRENNKCHCHIECIFLDTPIEICLKRLEERKRKVPVNNIYDKNLKMISCIHRYIPLVDDFQRISYFTNKYLLLDMDGTIAGYGKVKEDFEGNKDFVNSELFLHLRPVQHIIDFVKDNYDMKNVYIVTGVPNSVAWNEKNQWLDKYFPEIPKENRLFVGNMEYKHVFIKHYAIKKNWKRNDMTLIDDYHPTIEKCKKLGINCIHPSNIQILKDKYAFFS